MGYITWIIHFREKLNTKTVGGNNYIQQPTFDEHKFIDDKFIDISTYHQKEKLP